MFQHDLHQDQRLNRFEQILIHINGSNMPLSQKSHKYHKSNKFNNYNTNIPILSKSLDSREFKIILKPNLFKEFNSGIKKIQEVIDTEVKKLNGRFKSRDSDLKLKHRNTYYLDSSDFRLNSKNFFLRIREDKKSRKYDVTLKCRHPDRYISSAYDLSDLKIYDTKFEEDIIAPHISKFSTSVNFEQDQKPKFNSIEELGSIFPGLISYDIGHGKLSKVNNFEAEEISANLGKIVYDGKKNNNKDDNKVTLLLNLWYSPKDESVPAIVEFTYSYRAIKPSPSKSNKRNKDNKLIEEFPLSIVRNTYEFYKSLQKTNVVDLRASKTKTEFAYTYKS
jgi:hypothetical protein